MSNKTQNQSDIEFVSCVQKEYSHFCGIELLDKYQGEKLKSIDIQTGKEREFSMDQRNISFFSLSVKEFADYSNCIVYSPMYQFVRIYAFVRDKPGVCSSQYAIEARGTALIPRFAFPKPNLSEMFESIWRMCNWIHELGSEVADCEGRLITESVCLDDLIYIPTCIDTGSMSSNMCITWPKQGYKTTDDEGCKRGVFVSETFKGQRESSTIQEAFGLWIQERTFFSTTCSQARETDNDK